MTRAPWILSLFLARGLTVSLFSAILQGMRYPGGKAGDGVYQRLISLMPPHDIYIEPFLGGGALLRQKRPARRNIGIDLDTRALEGWEDRPDVELYCGDGVAFLQTYPFTGNELVYCDPPYVLSTRTGKQYRFEMTDAQHAALLAILTALPCHVMLSGY